MVKPSRPRTEPERRPAREPSSGRERGALVVGLSGAIGSGKSTVARMLRELGARVVEADAIVHRLLDEGAVRRQVAQRWGKDVLDRAGKVDRRRLGEKVFQDGDELGELERMLHPLVKAHMLKEIEAARREEGARLIVLDAALLFEAGLAGWCDVLVFVDAPGRARLARLARRHGWSAEEVERRERRQMTAEEKRKKSSSVVRNFGSLEELQRQVRELHQSLVGAEGAGPPGVARA